VGQDNIKIQQDSPGQYTSRLQTEANYGMDRAAQRIVWQAKENLKLETWLTIKRQDEVNHDPSGPLPRPPSGVLPLLSPGPEPLHRLAPLAPPPS